MIKYLYKYESHSNEKAPNLSAKQQSWNEIISELDQGLNGGKGVMNSVLSETV